jgi:hypothetical protein
MEAPIPQISRFQLDLLNILSNHCTDLKVHDEIISLIKRHSNDQCLTFSSNNLKSRSSFLKDLEQNMDTAKLKPRDIDINLTFGGQATISVFDLEAMIMSLIIASILMQPKKQKVMICSLASVKVTTQRTVMEKSILKMHGNLLDSISVGITTL